MTDFGMALLLVGAIMILLEAHVPTLGVLGGPGVVALGAGAVLAVAGLGGGIVLAMVSALVFVAAGLGILTLSLKKGLAVRRRRIRAGPERLIGHLGVVRAWSEPTGSVLVDGSLWRARLSQGGEDQPPELHEGDPVVVERLDGLTLAVRPAEDWELVR
jgi:membrane-bound ClpP family serine protease